MKKKSIIKTFVISEDLDKKLRKLAEEKDMSISAIVRQLINQHFSMFRDVRNMKFGEIIARKLREVMEIEGDEIRVEFKKLNEFEYWIGPGHVQRGLKELGFKPVKKRQLEGKWEKNI